MLSPQGIVTHAGRTDRFDQAVGTGWYVIAVDADAQGLLSADQLSLLDRLGGRVLSIGQGADWDVQRFCPMMNMWASSHQDVHPS